MCGFSSRKENLLSDGQSCITIHLKVLEPSLSFFVGDPDYHCMILTELWGVNNVRSHAEMVGDGCEVLG